MEENNYISAVSQPLIKDNVMCLQDLPTPDSVNWTMKAFYLFSPFLHFLAKTPIF